MFNYLLNQACKQQSGAKPCVNVLFKMLLWWQSVTSVSFSKPRLHPSFSHHTHILTLLLDKKKCDDENISKITVTKVLLSTLDQSNTTSFVLSWQSFTAVGYVNSSLQFL